MFEQLRKRQRELEEKPYPSELYGFETEIYEFFMLVDGSLDYVLADMIKNDKDLYQHILLYEQVRQEICVALSN